MIFVLDFFLIFDINTLKYFKNTLKCINLMFFQGKKTL
jgi:hypothetical protein